MHIAFENIDVTSDGVLRAEVVTDRRDELFIQLPWSFTPADDLVALAFSTLVGDRFQSLELDLHLGPNCRQVIMEATGAEVRALPGSDHRRRPGSEIALGFSGGFDSLAARSLLPPESHLVSLDLQGRFARERGFFEQFSPITLRTNLVDLGLNRHDPSFMLIGLILLRDELDLSVLSTGTILGSAMTDVLAGVADRAGSTPAQLRHLGVSMFDPVAGLTEAATVALVSRVDAELVPASLASLANPREEKAFRKTSLVRAVTSVLGLPEPRLPAPWVQPWFGWGDYYATDLSSIFVMKHLGHDVVAPGYAGDIPDQVVAAAKTLSLDFFLRVNPDAYRGTPTPLLAPVYEQLTRFGIPPWGRRDWDEAAHVDRLILGEESRDVPTAPSRPGEAERGA